MLTNATQQYETSHTLFISAGLLVSLST